uniref:NADH-ubiquinone oxidoreductase chain 2 n=1 Tax=Erotides cosnardi TaxID=2026643 RepID=A0A343C556_9COLE|nr:NADH dehydrogenase subunit 2 [Erotides cosnardi]
MLFLMTLIIGTLMSISSYTLMGVWMGLEINLLSMIPIMQKKMNLLSTESSIKYFITQAMASSILIMAIIMMTMKTGLLSTVEKSSYMMMNSALLTKMGMAPFHFWFPEVMEGLSWMNCTIMLTWQKLAPMVLVMYNMIFPTFMNMIIVVGLLISSIMSFNQISMRKLLTYSSINHMSWMMSSMMIMQSIWLYYFIIYVMITVNMTMLLNKNNISSMPEMFLSMNNNNLTKLLFMMNFMNLSGLPPFLGFLPKWMTIQMLINMNLIVLSTVMVITTTMMIFIYMKISMTSMILNMDQINWNFTMNKKNNFNMAMMNFMVLTLLITTTIIFNII